MAVCPFARQEPSPNHGGAVSGHAGCVIHVTAGESDPSGWFDNPTSQVSAHFGIGNGQGGFVDGELAQYVDTDFQSWAEMAGNATYVSVETEGEPTEALTTAQIQTFARLYAWLHAEYGFPFLVVDVPGEAGLITHGDGGAAWGGHTDCPGPLRTPQRAEIVYLAALAANPAPPPPPQMEEEEMTTWTDLKSDGTEALRHVTGVVNGVAYHWWQPPGGNPTGPKWNHEILPTS